MKLLARSDLHIEFTPLRSESRTDFRCSPKMKAKYGACQMSPLS
jgi:hypothetical protein